MTARKSNEQFEKELSINNRTVINLEPYKGARTKIQFQCKDCGYTWLATPDSVLRGSGCARCAGVLRKTQSEFVNEVERANPKIEVIGKYINNRAKIMCKCRVCGHVWDGDPIYLSKGTNCPNCIHSGTSFVEQCIFVMFEDYYGKGKVESRNKKAIGKELDVFIPERRIAIEYGSWFWHKSKQKQDTIKMDLCFEHNIDIVIVFDSFDNSVFPDKYNANIITFKDDLSNDDVLLHKMLENLLDRFGIESSITEEWFSVIKRRAYENCSRRSTALFQKEVSRISPNILIVSNYTTARKRIECQCLICGCRWTPFADNLLKGQGCPECAKKRQSQNLTLTHQEFINRIERKLNPNVEIIGKYINSNEKIACRCKKCGFEWDAITGDLHHGSGCPKCGGTMKKTHQEFLEEMGKINPDIEVIGVYSTHSSTVECRCKKCNYKWNPAPKHLLKGHGCPRCGRNLKKCTQDIIGELNNRGMNIDVIGEYKNTDSPLLFKCKECGYEWKQIPRNLFRSRGCPHCYPYTKKQDEYWNKNYSVALKYFEQYGNLDISASAEYCGVKLGQWIYCQRKAYRNSLLPEYKRNKSIGSISAKRIELLNKIGMKW